MSKGGGGGVSIVFGVHGQIASGEKRAKLVHATEIDTHLTQKKKRDVARKNAEPRPKKKKQGNRAGKSDKASKKPQVAPRIKGTGLPIPERIKKAESMVQSIEKEVLSTEQVLLTLRGQLASARDQLAKAQSAARRSASGTASQRTHSNAPKA
jgi:hypothetical protein